MIKKNIGKYLHPIRIFGLNALYRNRMWIEYGYEIESPLEFKTVLVKWDSLFVWVGQVLKLYKMLKKNCHLCH